MSIFAIGDLHLSFNSDKPMDIYGGYWVEHTKTLKHHWEAMISEDDTVILLGDTSWALKLEEARSDLEWLASLPGRKVLFKGNHDLWWSTISKLHQAFPELTFVQNQFADVENYAICGSRGWTCPGDKGFTLQDEKIYKRELLRVRTSLTAAYEAGYRQIYGALHYPPTNEKMEDSGFTDLFEEFGVKLVVYGHLHGGEAFENGLIGEKNHVRYQLASCDYLKCIPMKLEGD